MNESQRRDLQVFDFNQQDQINTDNHLFNKIPNHDSLAHDAQIDFFLKLEFVVFFFCHLFRREAASY
jgi:hypothetical protein